MVAIASNKRPVSNGLAIDVDFLKKCFLFGVSFVDDDGNVFSDEFFKFFIKSATRYVERELNILIEETQITNEHHDYYWDDYVQYSFLKLFNLPLQQVDRLAIRFPLSETVLNFDTSWIRAESISALVHLVPTQGTFSSILIGQGGSYLPMLYSGRDYVPMIFEVDYRAGFPQGQIPEDIQHVIGLKASIDALEIFGDLVVGAGIQSKQISLDGLSQGLVSSASAEFGGYSSRTTEYKKLIKDALDLLRRHYRPMALVVA